MEFLVLTIVIQVLLIVHCIRTGRNSLWIWVLALLSLPGALAYIAVELLPELLRSRGAKRAVRGVQQTLDPRRELRSAAERAQILGNVASKQEYADELTRSGRPGDAIPVYREALTGLYEYDPKLMLGLARALFDSEDAAGARATLDALIEHNPDFQSSDGHLLYARALETEGNVSKALEEYAALAPNYPGAEASVRYARLLRTSGRDPEAATVLRELLDEARMAPEHYRRVQREWLAEAERSVGATGG